MEKKAKTTGQRIDEMTDKISEVASEIGEKLENGAEETKKVATGVKKWREKTPIEEVVSTVVGIILLLCALWDLKKIIWGILLLLVGILCISGYFNPFLREIFSSLQSKIKDCKKKSKSENGEEKDDVKKVVKK